MITTLEMEISLMQYFGVSRHLITTNTHQTMFECDFLAISKAGYATGVEIKVSKGDLKNDLKKAHIAKLDENMISGGTFKEFYFGHFKRFYYAVPYYLEEAALNQIPDFCGLLIATNTKYYGVQIHLCRPPKKLYNYKWSDEKKFRIAWFGTMRILGLKQSILRLKNELKNINNET